MFSFLSEVKIADSREEASEPSTMTESVHDTPKLLLMTNQPGVSSSETDDW